MTDVTKITIAAVDQATEVFTKVQSSVERLQQSYTRLAAFLGIGIGVGSFAALIKSTIDAAEEIDKLSQKTGIAVQQLSALKYAAGLSGVDTDTLGKTIKALSKNLVEAGDSTSKAAGIFRAMGVDISGGPTVVLERLAGVFSQLKDGELKTTLATELFGKQGMQLIPFLNQGTEGIHKLTEEARRLGIVMDEEMTKAASQFNDNMKSVKASGEALAISLVNQAAPAMVRISAAMKAAAEDGGVLKALFIGVGGVLAETFSRSEEAILAAKVLAYKKEILVYEKQIEEARLEGLNVEGALTKASEERLKFLREELRLIQAAEALRRYGTEDQNDRRAQQGHVLPKGPDPDAIAAALRAQQAARQAQMDATISLMVKLEQEAAKLNEELTGQLANQTLINTQLELQKSKYGVIHPALMAIILAQAAVVDALRASVEYVKLLNEEHQKELDYAKQHGELLEKISNDWADQTKNLQDELKYLGLSNTERQKAVLLEKAREDIIAAGDDAATVRNINSNLQEQLGLLDRINQAQQQINIWSQAGEAAGRFFTDVLMHGKSAFQALRDEVKRFLAELISVFAKRWVLQLAAGAAGGAATAAGASLTNTAESTLASSASASLVTAGASYLGGGSFTAAGGAGTASLLGTGSLTAGGDFVGTGLAGMAGNMALAAGATDAFAASVAAAVPVIGWIVAIGVLLYSIFGHKGGGPKAGGSFLGSFGAGGDLLGDLTGTIDRRQHLHDETQLDSTAQQISTSLAAAISRTVTQLGGTSQAFQLGVGFNRDPSGTAPSMASTLLRDASGRTLFEQSNRNVSRDDGALETELTLQGQRALLAALQASNLPKEIADIVNSLVADSASAADIQKILAAAMDMKNVLDHFSEINLKGLNVEALKAWQRQGETLTQTMQRVGAAIGQFDDAFTTDAQKLDGARRMIHSAFDQLGIAIPDSVQAYYDLVHSIDVSTESGRHMVEVLLQVAPAFQNVTQATAAAIQTMYQNAAALSASFGKQYAEAALRQAAQQWLAIPGAGGNGFSVDDVIREIGGLIGGGTSSNPGGFADALKYVESLGPAAVDAFNALLSAYSAWQQSMQSTTGSLSPLTNGIGDLGNSASEAAQQLDDAKAGLRGYIDSLLVNDQLSPLSPTERLGAAKSQYEHLLQLAKGGDVNAISQLSGASDTYLGIARQLFASSSAYVDIFNQVITQLAGVSGYNGTSWQASFANALPSSSPIVSQADLRDAVRKIVAALGGVAAANDDAVDAQTEALASAVRSDPARR